MPGFTLRSPGPRLAALLALAAALPLVAFAEPAQYALDPVHTRVMFAVSHAGYSQAIGTISGSTGILSFNPGNWNTAYVQVQVPLARLDLGDGKWNAAALAGNLLDVERFPIATFRSTCIKPIDATHASVYGGLVLHGVVQPVKLDVTFNQLKRYPLPPFRRTVGFSATTTLSRKEFGIDAWPSVIGDSVELRIEAEASYEHAGPLALKDIPAMPALPSREGEVYSFEPGAGPCHGIDTPMPPEQSAPERNADMTAQSPATIDDQREPPLQPQPEEPGTHK